MLAVKAAYDNGILRWLQKPPTGRTNSVIVVFDDLEEGTPDSITKHQQTKEQAIKAIRGLCKNLPDGVSMVNNLIAERRQEAASEQ